jgi:hypothetical protein
MPRISESVTGVKLFSGYFEFRAGFPWTKAERIELLHRLKLDV